MTHSKTSSSEIFNPKLVHEILSNSCYGIFVDSRSHLDGKFLCDKHRTFKHHLETNTCPNRHWPPRQTTTWHNHFKISPRHLQRTFLIVFDVSFKPNIRPSLWSANTMTMSPKRLRKIFDLGGIYFNYPTIGWFSDGFKLFSIFID